MSDYQLDPYTWFTEREMSNTPKHFVMTKHILTAESKQWVLEKCVGRFSLLQPVEDEMMILSSGNIAFEDPQEAVFYELKWS